MSSIHPSIALSPLADPEAPIPADLDLCDALGGLSYGLSRLKLADDLALASGLAERLAGRVAYVHHGQLFTLAEEVRWAAQRAEIVRSLELAHLVGAEVLLATTGRAGSLVTWEEAAQAFTRAVEPVLPVAQKLGVRICVEQTNQLRQDISFVSTLADLVELAHLSGISICADMFWSWRERDLAESIRRSMPDLGLIQVADYLPGTMSMPDRVVPGDGIVPFEWLVAQFAAAGYRGFWDLELLGPRITSEGAPSAMSRGAHHLRSILNMRYPRADRHTMA